METCIFASYNLAHANFRSSACQVMINIARPALLSHILGKKLYLLPGFISGASDSWVNCIR